MDQIQTCRSHVAYSQDWIVEFLPLWLRHKASLNWIFLRKGWSYFSSSTPLHLFVKPAAPGAHLMFHSIAFANQFWTALNIVSRISLPPRRLLKHWVRLPLKLDQSSVFWATTSKDALRTCKCTLECLVGEPVMSRQWSVLKKTCGHMDHKHHHIGWKFQLRTENASQVKTPTEGWVR